MSVIEERLDVTLISKSKKYFVRWSGKRPATPIPMSGRNPIDRLGIETLFSRNETIFCKGQSARHIYKIAFGCVRTFIKLSDGRRLINSFYFPSDYFGLEMHEKHNLSAEAATPSMVLVIGKKELTSRAAIDIAVSKYMLNITNVELQRAQNRSLLLRNSIDDRVANFLFEIKKRNQRKKDVDVLMSRQDIADHLNVTIETVSRALTRLENKSAISFRTHRRIVLRFRKPLGT
jgi:CRP/FNR family nitrogen fixation transcriptional regulator